MTSLLDVGPSIQDRITAARLPGDLSTYAKAVHNLEIEPYQLAWEAALNEEDRTGIICPPDTFKSTTIQLWIEREIARNPNIRILWLMNAGEQAEKRVMTVAQTIDSNPVYRAAYNIRPNKAAQWTKSVLYVEREIDSPDPTLMGAGLNGAYQGLHFDIIIIDDPTNQEDVRSPTTMELQEQKIRGVVIDRLVEGGRIVFILTRWGENDLVHVFESMGFVIIEMPVISDKYPWGPTISNRRFSSDKIEQLRRDKGDMLFEMTYMCDPRAASGTTTIDRAHLRYWTRDMIPDQLDFYMGVDPAASTKTLADYSAITTVGRDPVTQNIFVLDVFAARLTGPELEAAIVNRATRIHGLRMVGVETIAYQLSLVQYLRRHKKLPLVELPYRSRRQAMRRVLGIDKDKVSRAAYLDQMFISGRLFLPRSLPHVDGISFETELITVPFGRHDDRMDATCFAVALADAHLSTSQKVLIKAFG